MSPLGADGAIVRRGCRDGTDKPGRGGGDGDQCTCRAPGHALLVTGDDDASLMVFQKGNL